MTSDKELEMLWKEAVDQKPSTNARKIMVLISTIREQREWLKRKDVALKILSDIECQTLQPLGSFIFAVNGIAQEALAIGSEQTK